jgi:hypothetical protein
LTDGISIAEEFFGLRFRQDESIRIFQDRVRISFEQGVIEYLEEVAVCCGDVIDSECPVPPDDHPVVAQADPDYRLQFRKFGQQVLDHRRRRLVVMKRFAGRPPVGNQSVYPIPFGVERVVAEFETDVKEDQEKGRHAYGQADDVQEREAFLAP